jgi:hypothetical protein
MEHYRMIDDRDVKSFLTGFSRFLRIGLAYILMSVRKNLTAALLIFLLVSGAGVFYSLRPAGKPYFQSDMACMFNNLNKKAYGEMVEKLNILARSASYNQLAASLHLSPEQAAKIISLEAKNISGSPLQEDVSPGSHSPIYFIAKTTDRSIFGSLQEALINYLNSSPYQQLRNKLELERLDHKTKFQEHNLRQIDSIIASYPAFLKDTKANDDSTSGLSSIRDLMTWKDSLENNMLKDEESKSFMQSVEVIHGFLPPDMPSRDGHKAWWLFVVLGFIAAVLGSLLINSLKNDAL